MTLGGFKFAGYKVTKPEGATDADWALLVHKARLKAFWDANAASGAGWEFDRTSGDADWNWGSGGGDVIYYADGNDAQNLVSFFKKTGSVTKYYLIATMFNWQASDGGTSGLVKISKGAVLKAKYSSGSAAYKVDAKTLFHTASYTRFLENCLDASADTYPQDALPLIPNCGWTPVSGTASTNSGSEKIKNSNSLYVGYAVKGTNIISFTSRTDTLTGSSSRSYVRVSIVGFDGLKLSSPNDSANIYGLCLKAPCTEIGVANWPSGILNDMQETLKSDFTRYPYDGQASGSSLALTTTKTATFNGSPQNYPFESVSLYTGGTRTVGPFLNADGITSKGTFDIDLISCNGTYTYEPFSIWSTVANGNYITAEIQYTGSGTVTIPQTTYYVGWDPSNPDITNPNSWPEYVEYP